MSWALSMWVRRYTIGKIKVGMVEGYVLEKNGRALDIQIFVGAPLS